MTIDLGHFMELDGLARADVQRYERRRELFSALPRGRHFIGIVGPRGVGKTILLRQLAAAQPASFYCSLDTSRIDDLFDLAKALVRYYKIKTLLLDEVHFSPHVQRDLKKIYDFLPGVRVIFTSSVALTMHESAHDLARRVRLVELQPFSLREYIRFVTGDELPPLTLRDIATGNWRAEHLRYEHHFEAYLRGGLYPFALEEPNPLPILRGIVDTIIHRDIPRVARLPVQELDAIEAVLAFIGRSAVDGINPSSVAKNIGISKYKAAAYLRHLAQGYVLIPVEAAGTNVLREPKVLMYLPYRLLHRSFEEAIGPLREDFFATMARIAGIDISYLKSVEGKKTPDFLVRLDRGEKLVVEIGGPGKGRSQFKGVEYDKKLVFSHGAHGPRPVVPLFLAGFLR
jgi:uncharacterized protein